MLVTLQIISRSGSLNLKDPTSSSQGLTQAEFLTLKNKCQASLATATDLEQYRQWLIQTLKQFDNHKKKKETEDTILLDDSHVNPVLTL